MKEWSLECYRRKYFDTVTIFNHKDKLSQYHINCIEEEDDKICFYGRQPKSTEQEQILGEPIYYRFESRFYISKNGIAFTSIKRKLKKSFLIGLSPENFSIENFTFPVGYTDIEYLKEPVINVENALKSNGLISPYILINNKNIYYLDRNIGIRKGSKFVINDAFKQEVKDCLVGHECTIT